MIELEEVIKTLVRNVLLGQELLPGFEKIEQYKVLLQELLKYQEYSMNDGESELVLAEVNKKEKVN